MMKRSNSVSPAIGMERIPEPTSISIFGFFGLRENPFSISPNPHFLYRTPVTEVASQQLVGGICNRKGLILLTGEVGTGKTLLLRRLLDWLNEQNMPTALIFNARVSPDHLLDLVLSDFGVPCKSSLKSDKLISLNRWLLDRYRLGQTPVLIIDEAHGLPLRTLEEIRLLLNLETPRGKVLQVILAGQPELEEKLRRDELRQVHQRITVRCKTASLTLHETQAYIQERLRTAGAKKPVFQPEAVAFVHAYSQGIPRVMNLLCEQSLINARADGSRVVYPQMVELAAQDCQLEQVDSVSRLLHSSHPPGSAMGEISSIFNGMSLLDSAPVTDVYSVKYPIVLETAPVAIDSEVLVYTKDSRSGEAVTGLEERSPQASDLSALLNDIVYPKSSAVLSPTLRAADVAQKKSASSANVAQAAPTSSPQVRSAQQGGGVGGATLRLLRGWWKSFSADARSTERRVERLLRTCIIRVRPRVQNLTNSLALFTARAWNLVSHRRKSFRTGYLSRANRRDSSAYRPVILNKGVPGHR